MVVGGTVVVVGALVVLTGTRVVVVFSGGTVLKTTSELVTVVTGLGAAVVATVGAGRVGVGAVVAGAGVVVVVVLSPKGSAAVTDPPRPLTFTVDGVGSPNVVVGCKREAMTRRVPDDWSRAVAAITMATKRTPTPIDR